MINLTNQYKKIFGNYWRSVDQKIADLILKHLDVETESAYEVGFGSGHYMAFLKDIGVNVSGTEIRKKAYQDVVNKFKNVYGDIELNNYDIMEECKFHDMAYSTGLIQCLKPKEREVLISHIADISDKVVYVVPVIQKMRNIGSETDVAVDGCEEYETGIIAYQLSKKYAYVETGFWNRDEIELTDDFQWFYCDNKRIKLG